MQDNDKVLFDRVKRAIDDKIKSSQNMDFGGFDHVPLPEGTNRAYLEKIWEELERSLLATGYGIEIDLYHRLPVGGTVLKIVRKTPTPGFQKLDSRGQKQCVLDVLSRSKAPLSCFEVATSLGEPAASMLVIQEIIDALVAEGTVLTSDHRAMGGPKICYYLPQTDLN